MSDYSNIPLGLNIPTQIPLDVKVYKDSEATLKNLGIGNNLAFTYYKGLIFYCAAEQTRYQWREVVNGEIGLMTSNFTYPNNIIAFGIDYSNKIYNFFKIVLQSSDQIKPDWNSTSGFSEILNKPTIPAAQVQSDWNSNSGLSQILNKPTIPSAQVQSDWGATSGISQILNKPIIPSAQVNADWNATDGISKILNKPSNPTLQTVTDNGSTTTNQISINNNSNTGLSSYSPNDVAIFGRSDSEAAIYGVSNDNIGVFGVSVNDSGVAGQSTIGNGVYGKSIDGFAIYGDSINNAGVCGRSDSGVGAFGYSNSFYGIHGFSIEAVGAYGYSADGIGVLGQSYGNNGGNFSSTTQDGLVVYSGGSNVIVSNMGLNSNGITINSGTSSIGKPIYINKNGVEKLSVNQQGEITATKFIKLGFSTVQFLMSDGSAIDFNPVTNVSALNITTTGTNITSSVSNPTTTPVITLNIPTASASNRGALSSADWSTFNSKQSSGNYITSLTGEASASGPGAASITLSTTAVTGKVLTGLSTITGSSISSTDSILSAFGKIQNQINALVGGNIYKGTWNASTNSPTLVSSVGTNGWYYIVNVAGSTNLNGISTWAIGDWAIFNGSTWQKVNNSTGVISINSQSGVVTLTTNDISEGSTNKYFSDTLSRNSLSFTAGSGNYNSSTGVITIPTNTNNLTNGANFITLASLSATAPILYNSSTGYISISQSDSTTDGYLNTSDWNKFNNKQPKNSNLTSISGISYISPGFLKMTGVNTFVLDMDTYLTDYNAQLNYIQNQSLTAQSADIWINGNIKGKIPTPDSINTGASSASPSFESGSNLNLSADTNYFYPIIQGNSTTTAGYLNTTQFGYVRPVTYDNGYAAIKITGDGSLAIPKIWKFNNDGSLTSTSFNGAGTGLNGTASSLNIGGYANSLGGYSDQTTYTVLSSVNHGPCIKLKYNSITTDRYFDIGWKDNAGSYTEGLKITNQNTFTWQGYNVIHSNNIASYAPTLTGSGASGTWGISISGNASTATILSTTRTINGVSFNGSANITVADSTKLPLSGGTLTGGLIANSFAIPAGQSSQFLKANGTIDTNVYALSSDLSGYVTLATTQTISGAKTFTSNVTALGFFNSSDIRLKDIISQDGDTIKFTWKDKRDDKKHIGYVAQEIQKTYPDQVSQDDNGMLTVNYIEVLVAKIQELENRIKILENK